MENSKPLEQHRWPGRTRQANSAATANLSSQNPSLFRSLDCGNGVSVVDKKIGGMGSGMVVKALQNSIMVDEGSRRASFDGRFEFGSGQMLSY